MRYQHSSRSFAPTHQEAHIDLMHDGSLRFQSPYDAGLVAALKAAIPHSDRQWNRTDKVWLVAPQWANTLADIAEQHLGERPDVPQVRTRAQKETQILDVRYLGAAKDRGNGEVTAFGWTNGGWNAIFPLAVLHEWFSVEQRPGEAPTLYAVLGVKKTVAAADLKSAYRRAARQWHPDMNSDPDAADQFRAIQHAWEILSNPLQRRKYDAGLFLASTVSQTDANLTKTSYGWRPPLRCGYILTEGAEVLGRFVVSRILQWEDIVNTASQTLVTSWRYGDDSFTERWV